MYCSISLHSSDARIFVRVSRLRGVRPFRRDYVARDFQQSCCCHSKGRDGIVCVDGFGGGSGMLRRTHACGHGFQLFWRRFKKGYFGSGSISSSAIGRNLFQCFQKRRMNFQSARQISDGAAVAASRKSNAADGNSGKIFSEM